MSQGLTTKKRILLLILSGLPIAAFLILCWYYLPKHVFGLLVIGLMLLGAILEAIVSSRQKRKNKESR
jgi:Flp pilus assembly protein TadB